MCLITTRTTTEDVIPPRRVYRDKATGAYFSESSRSVPRRSKSNAGSVRSGYAGSVRSHSGSTRDAREVREVREVRHVYPAAITVPSPRGSFSRGSDYGGHSPRGSYVSYGGNSARGSYVREIEQPVIVVQGKPRSVRGGYY